MSVRTWGVIFAALKGCDTSTRPVTFAPYTIPLVCGSASSKVSSCQREWKAIRGNNRGFVSSPSADSSRIISILFLFR